MSFDKFKLINDQEDHFELQHPKGETFKVQKSKLSPVAVQAIQGLADGGKVNPLSPNAPAMPGDETAMPTQIVEQALFTAPQVAFPKPSVEDVAKAREEELQKHLEQIDKMPAWMRPNDPEAFAYQQMAQERKQQEEPAAPSLLDKLRNLQMSPEAKNKLREQAGLPPVPGTPPAAPAETALRDLAQLTQQQPPMAGMPQEAVQKQLGDILAPSQFQKQMAQAPGQLLGAVEKTAKEQQAASQEYLTALQKLPTVPDVVKKYQDSDKQFMDHLVQNQIDPNRYMKNLSTTQKIAGGIALLFAGMGGGASGRNVVLDQINQAIKEDIDAQKDDRSKALNLWKMNREAMHDELAANSATANQMLSMTQAKLAMAASHTQNAQARINALGAIQAMEQEKNKNRLMIAMTQVPGAASDPSLIQMLPDEVKKVWVVGYGPARTSKVADTLNTKVATVNNIKAGIDKLLALSQKGSAMSLTDQREAKTLSALLTGALRTEVVGPGAVSESEWKLLNTVVANPLALGNLRMTAESSLNTLKSRLNDDLDFALTQGGLKPKQRLQMQAPRR